MNKWSVSEKSIYDENGQQIIEASEWYMRGKLQEICNEHKEYEDIGFSALEITTLLEALNSAIGDKIPLSEIYKHVVTGDLKEALDKLAGYMSSDASKQIPVIEGIVDEAEYQYQRVSRIKPMVIHYSENPKDVKYVCPVCRALGNKHQMSYGKENCPLCNVNLIWDGIEF